MAEANRDTIYVDIDDEITGIIDKVRSSDAKIAALVLPKRATVFQSIVNMKLLKRAADQAGKRVVLITGEAGLLPLAGSVGLHVARTLTTKPAVPEAPLVDDGREEMVEESASLEDEVPAHTAENAADVPIGELAGLSTAQLASRPPLDGVETIDLDDIPDEPRAGGAAAAVDEPRPQTPKKPKKNSKLKIPNFERFRLIAILLILLIVVILPLLFIALSVLPKASIHIQTNASNVNTNVDLTLSTNATSLNTQTNTVPAKLVSEAKTFTGTAPATGQQNNGQTATGSVTFSAPCSANNFMSDIPAGTGISTNGNTYITQADAVLDQPGGKKGSCDFNSSAIAITAQSPGAKYNTGQNTSFTLAASNSGSYDASSITATGDASGGTDSIQQVVQQSDIATAQSKINATNDQAKQDLEQQLQQDNLYAIPATYNAGTPTTTSSVNAGAAASSVTVTETITYTMFGAPASDLHTLLANNIKSQVNGAQNILSDGLSNASFTTSGGSLPATGGNLTLSTTAEVGPDINVAEIKSQSEGKKSGDVIASIKNNADVTNVTVQLSPFWVTTVPKNPSKISVTIAKPSATVNQ